MHPPPRSCHADVCCTGTPVSIKAGLGCLCKRPDWHDRLNDPPEFVLYSLFPPHLDLGGELVFSTFCLTIRTGQVLRGPRSSSLDLPASSPSADPTQLYSLVTDDLRLSSLFPQKWKLQLENNSKAKATTQGKVWNLEYTKLLVLLWSYQHETSKKGLQKA